MNKTLVGAIVGLLVLCGVGVAGAQQPTGERVNVCHREGNGTYHVINVSVNALPAHLAHGDIYPVPESGCSASATTEEGPSPTFPPSSTTTTTTPTTTVPGSTTTTTAPVATTTTTTTTTVGQTS